MNTKVLMLFLLTTSLPAVLISSTDPIKTADSLVVQRQYATAFELLHGLPNSNDDRVIVSKKIDIALNYFAISIGHAVFGFKDLQPGEDLMEIRGKTGKYSSFAFPIDSVLLRLLSRYPKDGNLYRYLGDYYDDVSRRYSKRWLISDDSLASLVKKNYLLARRLKASTYNSLHRLGVVSLEGNDPALAETCFKEAIALSPEQADPYYNLAYLYMQKKQTHQAISSGVKSFQLYKDVNLRSDAGRLIASCYFDLGDFGNALKYLREVDAFDPSNYYVYRSILYAHLKLGFADSASQDARRLFSLHPTYPSMTQAIMKEYASAGQGSQAIAVLRGLLPEHSRNDTASGNLHFHLAQLLYEDSQIQPALEELNSAEASFRRCYSSDHQVFKAIRELREAMEKPQ